MSPVVSKNSDTPRLASLRANPSRRFPIVEIEQPAQTAAALDITCSSVSKFRPNDPALQPLMISLPMVMLNIFADHVAQGPFTEQDHLIQALLFDRTHKTLREGIEIRRSLR